MNREQEYLDMMNETANFVAKEKIIYLEGAATALNNSAQLVNNVEFWRWMGNNYPQNLSNTQLIQRTAIEKTHWMNTQLQGKGYEWDFMTLQRSKPSNILSSFKLGDSPTQPGIDMVKKNLLNGSVTETYQNKAYLSSNSLDLHNTPQNAIVVTNKEKIYCAQQKGFQTEEYLNADKIQFAKNERLNQAIDGNANTTYTFENVVSTSAKAGIMSAVIGLTTETIASYHAWKSGELSDEQYLKEVLRAGGDAGVTGAATGAALIPIQATITAAGLSSLISVPIAITLSSTINSIIAPCFARGKYRQILNEAKYYQAIEDIYDDFIMKVEQSSEQYISYIKQIQQQKRKHVQLQQLDKHLNQSLKDLYDSI